ncbi:MAG: helix-turn-helix transcriptional regulator [Eubacteriales bacterium]|nr:helix-turn-helix transcriptional regulator [Eubacteriales bacterium]
MTFGEKVQTLRKERGLSQTEFGKLVGVSLRTVRGWENEGRYPRYRDLYKKIAEVLECETSYIMTDEESFISEVSENYGSRGVKQAQAILDQAAAMFAGGDLSDEDQIAFLNEIQTLYLDSKKRAKKYTPKKYLKSDATDSVK